MPPGGHNHFQISRGLPRYLVRYLLNSFVYLFINSIFIFYEKMQPSFLLPLSAGEGEGPRGVYLCRGDLDGWRGVVGRVQGQVNLEVPAPAIVSHSLCAVNDTPASWPNLEERGLRNQTQGRPAESRPRGSRPMMASACHFVTLVFLLPGGTYLLYVQVLRLRLRCA